MPEPLKAAALRGLGGPRATLVIVDPGESCGVAVRTVAGALHTNKAQLAEMPLLLRELLHTDGDVILVCEDYHLLSGKAKQQAGSRVPSAIGIGMCRVACEWADTPLYLVPPNIKRAGHQALDAAGRDAYAACRNDHERDVVDIAGYVLREMRRTS